MRLSSHMQRRRSSIAAGKLRPKSRGSFLWPTMEHPRPLLTDLEGGWWAPLSKLAFCPNGSIPAVSRFFTGEALIHAFFGEREVAKVPDIPSDTPALPIKKVGVVGAGTMGSGIAMALANSSLPVLLKDADPVALQRGMARIRKNYENSVKRGRITAEEMAQRLALIQPRSNYEDFNDSDLIIEAVFEALELKKQIFAELDKIAKPECVLATNTSPTGRVSPKGLELADRACRPFHLARRYWSTHRCRLRRLLQRFPWPCPSHKGRGPRVLAWCLPVPGKSLRVCKARASGCPRSRNSFRQQPPPCEVTSLTKERWQGLVCWCACHERSRADA